MQSHKRNKFVPLTVEAKVERLAFALKKMKEMEDKLDAITACLGNMHSALGRVHEGASRQLAEPRNHANDQYALFDIAITCESVLAATTRQSLAAIKVKILREVLAVLTGADEPEETAAFLVEDMIEQIEKIERGGM